MSLPVIGSTAFRTLSFQDQLEICALKLFKPDEYEVVCDIKSTDNQTLPQKDLDYPPLPEVSVVDLPVSVLRNYWAGYSCLFRERWYLEEFRGITPLDDFGVDYRKLVNISTFTFPVLSLEPALSYVFRWLLDKMQKSARVYLLLVSCKVYAYLSMQLQNESAFELFRYDRSNCPFDIVSKALEEYKDVKNFVTMNFVFPIVEECYEMTWFECSDLVLHEQARFKDGRYFFPLVPSGLYTAPRFRIDTWQFLK